MLVSQEVWRPWQRFGASLAWSWVRRAPSTSYGVPGLGNLVVP